MLLLLSLAIMTGGDTIYLVWVLVCNFLVSSGSLFRYLLFYAP